MLKAGIYHHSCIGGFFEEDLAWCEISKSHNPSPFAFHEGHAHALSYWLSCAESSLLLCRIACGYVETALDTLVHHAVNSDGGMSNVRAALYFEIGWWMKFT